MSGDALAAPVGTGGAPDALPPSAAWLVGHRRYAQTLVLLAMVLACATEAPVVAVAGVLCLTLRFLIDKFHHLQVRRSKVKAHTVPTVAPCAGRARHGCVASPSLIPMAKPFVLPLECWLGHIALASFVRES